MRAASRMQAISLSLLMRRSASMMSSAQVISAFGKHSLMPSSCTALVLSFAATPILMFSPVTPSFAKTSLNVSLFSSGYAGLALSRYW